MQTIQPQVRGLVVCITVSFAAFYLATFYNAPVMIFALLLGMSLNFLANEDNCSAGIELASGGILRLGVALLGLRVLFSDLTTLGWAAVILVITCTISTILFGILLSKVLRLPLNFGILSSGSVAICGISAALAISAVLPKRREEQDYLLNTIMLVAACGSFAMVTYPLLMDLLQLDVIESGVFLGATIHDVSHVVGASYSLSEEVGDLAIITKMLRVALLLPIVATIPFLLSESKVVGTKRTKLPLFLIAFIGLALLANLIEVPALINSLALSLSNWCLAIAIVALGIKTTFRGLLSKGWRPFILVVSESLFLGLFAFLLIKIFL